MYVYTDTCDCMRGWTDGWLDGWMCVPHLLPTHLTGIIVKASSRLVCNAIRSLSYINLLITPTGLPCQQQGYHVNSKAPCQQQSCQVSRVIMRKTMLLHQWDYYVNNKVTMSIGLPPQWDYRINNMVTSSIGLPCQQAYYVPERLNIYNHSVTSSFPRVQ